jgi:transposase-like protein
MAKARRRKRYSGAQRTNILETAKREGLTASQVKTRFGVTPVTYYSWRKKTGGVSVGASARRGGHFKTGDITSQVREEVRIKIRELLPEIVRGEVSQLMSGLTSRRRGRPRRV